MKELATVFSKLFASQAIAQITGTDHGAFGSSCGYTNFSYTEDYFNRYHYDLRDNVVGGIFWFQEGSPSQANGSFQIPSLRAMFAPQHGSLLLLDTRQLLHGTGPMPETRHCDQPLIGCALFSKPQVIQDVTKATIACNLLREEFGDVVSSRIIPKSAIMGTGKGGKKGSTKAGGVSKLGGAARVRNTDKAAKVTKAIGVAMVSMAGEVAGQGKARVARQAARQAARG